MKVFDLTHTMTPTIPVFPGTEQPVIEKASDYGSDGYRESSLAFYSHVGTHMDAPAHIIPGGIELDSMDVNSFFGTAAVVDCSDITCGEIGMEHITPRLGILDSVDFILFYTGHSRFWGSAKYFEPSPWLSMDAARYIVLSGKKGVGIDTFSVDPFGCLDSHGILLSGGAVIIENLCGLEQLTGATTFELYAMPLKFEHSDGAPVRAAAIIR